MRTLVVTRPEPDASQWVQRLNEKGIAATALPMLIIQSSSQPTVMACMRKAFEQLASYDALMFVSANAVRHFFDSISTPAASLPERLQYWSPGPGTSQALIDLGVTAQQIIQPDSDALQFDSESLWQQAQRSLCHVRRVLIVRGGDGIQTVGQGRQWLGEQLVSLGITVDFISVYERIAPAPSTALLTAIENFRAQQAWWLFSSSECLQNLRYCAPNLSWQKSTALVTHPRIAQQAHLAGFGRVEQTQPSPQAIAASIESLHDHH